MVNLIMFLETPWSYLKLKRNLQKPDFDFWGPGPFISSTGPAWARGLWPLILALLLGAPSIHLSGLLKSSLLMIFPLVQP
jgi:hypothetical protein